MPRKSLRQRIDNERQHSRTGCVLHPSYPPAKLLWLFETQPETFRAAQRWMSFGEYLFLELFGTARCSTSMISASGLWDQNANEYDREILEALPVQRSTVGAGGTRWTRSKPSFRLVSPRDGPSWTAFHGFQRSATALAITSAAAVPSVIITH